MLIFILVGCTVVKRYPKNKAFFFENNIKIDGSLRKKEKLEIKTQLYTQIEDSAQVKVASKIPWPSFPWVIPVSVIEEPTEFNKQQVLKSSQNMKNSLNSLGYRRNLVGNVMDTIVKKDQLRIRTNYLVEVGPIYKIDSIVYIFDDSLLQAINNKNIDKSFVKKGKAFDYSSVDQELNRLIELFQNNGYYKITKEDIVAEVDTIYAELLDPTLDPIEYARAVSIVQSKSNTPEVDLFLS